MDRLVSSSMFRKDSIRFLYMVSDGSLSRSIAKSYRDGGASPTPSHSLSSAFLSPGLRTQSIILCFSWPSKSPSPHQHILVPCSLCINWLAYQQPASAFAATSSRITTYANSLHSLDSGDDGTRKKSRGPLVSTAVHYVSRSAMGVSSVTLQPRHADR